MLLLVVVGSEPPDARGQTTPEPRAVDAAPENELGLPEVKESPQSENGSVEPVALAELPGLFPTGDPAQTDDQGALNSAAKATPLDKDELTALLDGLGADEFAQRERAAVRLSQLGPEILPLLREVQQQATDPEVRFRVAELAKRLQTRDVQQRIEKFLAGDDVDFDGWSLTRKVFGDSAHVRELFVRMHLRHPKLLQSLERGPGERESALEQTAAEIQPRINLTSAPPADLIALVLPANDPQVQVSALVEDTLLMLLRRGTVRTIFDDARIGDRTAELVVGAIKKTGLQNRQEFLWMALDMQMPQALPVALETLQRRASGSTLVVALQVIARFGSRRDIPAIVPLLDRNDVVLQQGLQASVQTRVSDAAMATIALLSDSELLEVGFREDGQNRRMGFIPEDIGFASDGQERRDKVLGEIKRIINENTAELEQQPNSDADDG